MSSLETNKIAGAIIGTALCAVVIGFIGDALVSPQKLGFTAPARADPEPDGPSGQLYDLVADPSETRNLWLEDRATVRRLTERLAEIRR